MQLPSSQHEDLVVGVDAVFMGIPDFYGGDCPSRMGARDADRHHPEPVVPALQARSAWLVLGGP
jgi:hypothetical protein